MKTGAKHREVLAYQPASGNANDGLKLIVTVAARLLLRHYMLSLSTLCIASLALTIIGSYQDVMNWQFAPAGSRRIWVSSYTTIHVYHAGRTRPMTASENVEFNRTSQIPVGLREKDAAAFPFVFRSSTVDFWRQDQIQRSSHLKLELHLFWLCAALVVGYWLRLVHLELSNRLLRSQCKSD